MRVWSVLNFVMNDTKQIVSFCVTYSLTSVEHTDFIRFCSFFNGKTCVINLKPITFLMKNRFQCKINRDQYFSRVLLQQGLSNCRKYNLLRIGPIVYTYRKYIFLVFKRFHKIFNKNCYGMVYLPPKSLIRVIESLRFEYQNSLSLQEIFIVLSTHQQTSIVMVKFRSVSIYLQIRIQ